MKENESNCEAIYWKGKALKESGDFEAAIKSYEHAVAINKSQSSTLRSIFDLAVIRLHERDIYLAFYTLSRIEDVPEDLNSMCQLKLFLNGAVNMIKKKFQDGMDDFSKVDVLKLKEPMIESLMMSYQAYGNFCLGGISQALEMYTALEQRQQLVEGDVYNKLMCQGIISGEDQKFENAKSYFEKAKSIFRTKVEPTFYLAVTTFL